MAKPISTYINLFSSVATQRGYCTALKRFFGFIENPDAPIRRTNKTENGGAVLVALDTQAEEYLSSIRAGERSAADDLVLFMARLSAEFAPASVQVTRGAVIGFFEENEIELTRLEARRVKKRVPRRHGVTEEETVTREHLRTVLPLLSVRDRAVVLVMLSSGGRIGEVLKLRLQDVDLDAVPSKVVFRGATTKNGERRFSFVTPEAADAVRTWLTVRDEYIVLAAKRTRGLVAAGRASDKATTDNRLFPFHRTSFDLGWAKALERAGFSKRCEETGRLTLHPHGFRKFFRTQLGAAAGPDVAEELMGHAGYLSDSYRRFTLEQLQDAYSKNCHVLVVGEGGGDLARQLTEQREAMDALKAENAAMRQENAQVRAALEAVQAKADAIESAIAAIERTDAFEVARRAAEEAAREALAVRRDRPSHNGP